jgi:hypothetical protein
MSVSRLSVKRQGLIVRRDQLEHLIRAAGDLLGEQEIIVIGSQAILASVEAPAAVELVRSMEADLLPLRDPDEAKADLIDGVLGAGSLFDDTHGIHGDGVSASTPTLPTGWRDRLVDICNANTRGVHGLCLEAHDLVISKMVAGRGKDLEFCQATVEQSLVSPAVLRDRLAATDLDTARRERILRWITAMELRFS